MTSVIYSENRTCEVFNMRILAIDPGNAESGYAIMEMPDFKLLEFGKVDNHTLIKMEFETDDIDEVVIERVASMGMAVGQSVFETCEWVGRFTQMLIDYGVQANYVYRMDEKIMICGSMKAKDSNIRQALIDRYARFDFKNGKGTKSNKDTFYGVSKDVWQAIAVGVTYWEVKQDR